MIFSSDNDPIGPLHRPNDRVGDRSFRQRRSVETSVMWDYKDEDATCNNIIIRAFHCSHSISLTSSPTTFTQINHHHGQNCNCRRHRQSVSLPSPPSQPNPITDQFPGVASEIVDALVATKKHDILILTRSDPSSKTAIPGVTYAQTDYSSVDDLTELFKGTHTVLSFLAAFDQESGIASQKCIIDACVKAGVKRLAPSEWVMYISFPQPFPYSLLTQTQARPLPHPLVRLQRRRTHLPRRTQQGQKSPGVLPLPARLLYKLPGAPDRDGHARQDHRHAV